MDVLWVCSAGENIPMMFQEPTVDLHNTSLKPSSNEPSWSSIQEATLIHAIRFTKLFGMRSRLRSRQSVCQSRVLAMMMVHFKQLN